MLDFIFNQHIRRETDPTKYFLRLPFFTQLCQWASEGTRITEIEQFQRLNEKAFGLLLAKCTERKQTEELWRAFTESQNPSDISFKYLSDAIYEAAQRNVSTSQMLVFLELMSDSEFSECQISVPQFQCLLSCMKEV